jgi:hypothetical protein
MCDEGGDEEDDSNEDEVESDYTQLYWSLTSAF